MRAMHGGQKRAGRLLAANISSALLAVFAFAIAAGYVAGASFRPSPAPLAPTVSPIVPPHPIEPPPRRMTCRAAGVSGP